MRYFLMHYEVYTDEDDILIVETNRGIGEFSPLPETCVLIDYMCCNNKPNLRHISMPSASC